MTNITESNSLDLSKQQIVFVHGSLGMGGAEILRISVLDEMVRRKANVRVVVLRQPGELADRVRKLGVQVDVLSNRGGLFDLPGVLRLAKYFRQHRPQIVQSSQFLTNLHTRLACWFSRVPIHIIEEHGIYKWKRWYHRLLDRWVNARAAGVIACSQRVAESAAQDLGLPVNQVHVVHNCVGHDHLEEGQPIDQYQLRQSLVGGDQPPKRLVGIVGTLRWEKGHKYLLQAWKHLYEQKVLDEHDHLLIAGDGPMGRELQELARGLTNVHFLGTVSDTRRLLAALDLFVLPSINEGFGIAIIEAMAAGVPVISTRSGGIPEIITPFETGVLVEPKNRVELANAIEFALMNREKSFEMAEKGREKVAQCFIPKAYVDRLAEVYRQLSEPSK